MMRIYCRRTEQSSQAELHNAAWSLLYYVLMRDFFIDCKSLKLKKNSYGKPYFEGCRYSFSLCHTDGLVLAAVSDHLVGIDAELSVRRIDNRVAKRFLHMEKAKMSDWTRYESIGKMLGCGIPIPNHELSRIHYIRFYDDLPGYTVCCASEANCFAECVEIIEKDPSEC